LYLKNEKKSQNRKEKSKEISRKKTREKEWDEIEKTAKNCPHCIFR
jgi:hypothetical protein